MKRCTKSEFIKLIDDPTPDNIKRLDAMFCGCGYVHHWFYNMNYGRWNPMLHEMDYELRNVLTASDLYDFLITKTK